MNNDTLVSALLETPQIRNAGLTENFIRELLTAHSDIILKSLIENGYVDLGNGLLIEIVKLTDRVHVLRGIPYKSSRKYKLKLNMEDSVYRAIEAYYNQLEEEIL